MPSVHFANHLHSLNQDSEKVKALVPQAYRLLREGKAYDKIFQSPYKELFQLNTAEISYTSGYGYYGDLFIWLRKHLLAEMEEQKYTTPTVTKLVNAVKSAQDLTIEDIIISLMETKKFLDKEISKDEYQGSIKALRESNNVDQKIAGAVLFGLGCIGIPVTIFATLSVVLLVPLAITFLIEAFLIAASVLIMVMGTIPFIFDGNKERKEVAEIMEEISNTTPESTQVKSSDFPSSSANNSGFFQAAKVYPDLNDEPRLNLGNV